MIKTPDYIHQLKPYIPGRTIEEIKREYGLEKIHKLASNENPLGPSKHAVEAMEHAFSELHRYPDVAGQAIREKIAEFNNVKFENIAIGNGSEGIMAVTLRSFLEPGDEILSSEKTFIGFQVLARGRMQNYVEIPMIPREYKFDLERIKNSVNEKTKIVYVCNPNNPTGTINGKKEFEEFIKAIPKDRLVIIDEAYYEFAKDNPDYPDSITYLEEFENIIILRTFSKIYGIAGIRIGYSISSKEIADTIMKVKLPFEPGSMAQAGGLASLEDDDFVRRSLDLNRTGYEYVTSEYTKLGLNWVESFANFVMIDFGSEDKVNEVNQKMLRQGVIIRPLKAFGLPECLRITIGLMEENQAMIEALKKSI